MPIARIIAADFTGALKAHFSIIRRKIRIIRIMLINYTCFEMIAERPIIVRNTASAVPP